MDFISPTERKQIIEFYTQALGFSLERDTENYAVLRSPKGETITLGGNRLGEQDVAVENLDSTLESLGKLGGTVRERWEFPEVIGARCEDPQGNPLLVWQSKHP